ncbi:hypothetical protein LCI18_002277 [Fusarium solani-melongenae]|uniref:Uncharacterized protein n=1 Tax=Fusarium solani subsp. cucurbitae TaxID=2747967 RepID=A0ACD3YQZ0_FUSSC|nr:hypothetical protein LCI18_002277 [Fusarium solani-melongenae]
MASHLQNQRHRQRPAFEPLLEGVHLQKGRETDGAQCWSVQTPPGSRKPCSTVDPALFPKKPPSICLSPWPSETCARDALPANTSKMGAETPPSKHGSQSGRYPLAKSSLDSCSGSARYVRACELMR